MIEPLFEFLQDGYTLSTAKDRLDIQMIHEFLSQRSYWAKGRSLESVEKSIQHSLCFGLYAADGKQVGFARLVTDTVTFAWLCDVFILEAWRGLGLGKWLVECIASQPELASLRLFILATKNAHELYRQYGGFQGLSDPGRWMQRVHAK